MHKLTLMHGVVIILGYLCGIEEELGRKISSKLKGLDLHSLNYSTVKKIEEILTNLKLNSEKVDEILETIFSNANKRRQGEEEEEDEEVEYMTDKVL